MSNPNFTSILATTINKYRPRLTDNITGHNALWYELKENGGIREESGGATIVEPLLIGRNSTVRSYRGYEPIDTSPQEGISAAQFEWKQNAGSVSISGFEEFVNQGKEKIISLLQSKLTQLELSLMLEMNRQLHADGTGNGGRDFTGLALAVEDGAAWSTYGGIDSNANSYWRNQWIGGTATFSSAGLSRMRTMYNSCSRGGMKPNLILTSQYLFEQYEALAVGIERLTDTRLADMGFQNIMFKMTPIVFDDDMPFEDLATDEHQMLFLNTQFINFVVGKGKNFTNTEWQKPENQEAKVSQVIVYGNFTVSNRARLGRITDLT